MILIIGGFLLLCCLGFFIYISTRETEEHLATDPVSMVIPIEKDHVLEMDQTTNDELIQLASPRPGQSISSPLIVQGKARGSWFFEASFPVVLIDWDGKIIAHSIAQAKGDWMTTEFVPFETTLTFTVDKDVYSDAGTLILRKDNPSGLPEHDDALEIPIVFARD